MSIPDELALLSAIELNRIATLRGKSEAMESIAGFVHELCMRDDQSVDGIRICSAIINHIADLHSHLKHELEAA